MNSMKSAFKTNQLILVEFHWLFEGYCYFTKEQKWQNWQTREHVDKTKPSTLKHKRKNVEITQLGNQKTRGKSVTVKKLLERKIKNKQKQTNKKHEGVNVDKPIRKHRKYKKELTVNKIDSARDIKYTDEKQIAHHK